MKFDVSRISIGLAVGMVVCFTIAGIVGCTTFHGCTTSSENSTTLKDNAVIPANINELIIETTAHDVSLQTGTETDGKIILENKTSSSEKEFTLDVSTNAKQMSIIVRNKHPQSFHMGNFQLRLLVTLPQNYSGTIKVVTVSGDVSTTTLTLSACEFSTVSGDIKIPNLNSSSTKFTSTSGDINIDNLTAQNLHIKTVSGDSKIILATNQLKQITGNTVSGDINLTFPSNPNLTINFNSVSGDIDSKLPITSILNHNSNNYGNNNIQGTIGAGGTILEFKTVSGDITLN